MGKAQSYKKENRLGLIVFILSIIICLITISYAAWYQIYSGKQENTLTTGTLILNINNENNNISILNAAPIDDSKGILEEPYTFTLQNSGDVDVSYNLSIVDDDEYYTKDNCKQNKLDWQFLRYAFTEGNTTPIIADLSTNSGILKTGIIEANTEINFSLRLWLKTTATNQEMGKHFHARIKVEALQSN